MTNSDWQSRTDLFFGKKEKRKAFSFQELCKTLNLPNNEESKAYVAYLTHLGVIKCKNQLDTPY